MTETVLIHELAHGQRVWHPTFREEGTVFHSGVLSADMAHRAWIQWTDGTEWPLSAHVAADLVQLGLDLPRAPRRR